MNLLNELTQLLTPTEKAVARLNSQKADGVWIAQTLAGATLPAYRHRREGQTSVL